MQLTIFPNYYFLFYKIEPIFHIFLRVMGQKYVKKNINGVYARYVYSHFCDKKVIWYGVLIFTVFFRSKYQSMLYLKSYILLVYKTYKHFIHLPIKDGSEQVGYPNNIIIHLKFLTSITLVYYF